LASASFYHFMILLPDFQSNCFEGALVRTTLARGQGSG
jgi:hypothetical protein